MRKTNLTWPSLFLLLALTLCAGAISAQEAEAVYLEVSEVQVRPDMEAQYQKGVGALVAEYKKHSHTLPFIGRRGADGSHRFITPIGTELGAGIDASTAEGARVSGAVGAAKWRSIQQTYLQAAESVAFNLYQLRPDLGYQPSNPAVDDGEAGYYRYEFVSVKRDKVEEFEAAAKAWAAAYKKHDIKMGWITTQLVYGADQPLFLYVSAAKSPEHFYNEAAKAQQQLGADWQRLIDQQSATMRSQRVLDVTPLPDLTYQPAGGG